MDPTPRSPHRARIPLTRPPWPQFRRVDHPLDELGNPGGGLHDLTVILDEDLDAGLLDEIVRRDPAAELVYI